MLTRKILRKIIRQSDAIQVNQIWMKPVAFDFSADPHGVLLKLESIGFDRVPMTYSWQQLLNAGLKEDDGLLLANGDTLSFYKMTKIPIG